MTETSGILVGIKLWLSDGVSPIVLDVMAMHIPDSTASAVTEISNSGASFVGFTSLVTIYTVLMLYFCFPQRLCTDLVKMLRLR
jgi:hypothetical protein